MSGNIDHKIVFVLFIDLAVVLAVLGLWILLMRFQRRVDRKEKARDRGFEVKIKTVVMPVTEKIEESR